MSFPPTFNDGDRVRLVEEESTDREPQDGTILGATVYLHEDFTYHDGWFVRWDDASLNKLEWEYCFDTNDLQLI